MNALLVGLLSLLGMHSCFYAKYGVPDDVILPLDSAQIDTTAHCMYGVTPISLPEEFPQENAAE